MIKKILPIALIFFFLSFSTIKAQANYCTPNGEPKAFPEAEGFGALTTGGRGGVVYNVTNLNDSGSGSLRECVEAVGSRICVFDVGGNIILETPLNIDNPNITVAGQTSPIDGGGITLTINQQKYFTPIRVRADDVIIQYIRSRPGLGNYPLDAKPESDAISIGWPGKSIQNIVIANSSFSWSTDEILDIGYDTKNVTLQSNIFANAINTSKGRDIAGKGPIFWGPPGYISVHNNLFAHNNIRNPMISNYGGLVELINNVIYNPYNQGTILFDSRVVSDGLVGENKVQANIVSNFYKKGPNTPIDKKEILVSGVGNINVYLEGNIGWNGEDQKDLTNYSYETDRISGTPPIQVTTTTAQEAYSQVSQYAGARKPVIDQIDENLIDNVLSGTGRFISDPEEVGGWPVLDKGTPKNDSDNDYLPDEWEMKYFNNLISTGLETNRTAIKDTDNDGYTDFEEYLNNTDPTIKEPGCNGSPLTTTTPTPPIGELTPTPSQTPDLSFDHNNDDKVDILDLIEVIRYLFR